MNTSQRIRLVLFGGRVDFLPDPKDIYRRKRRSLFKKGGLRFLVLALIILLLQPLLCVQSKFGFIKYEYPPNFSTKSFADQYLVIFLYHTALVIKRIYPTDIKYSEKIPNAKGQLWKFVIFLTFLLGDGISAILIITSCVIFYKNVKEHEDYNLHLQPLNLEEKISYGSFLPCVPRRP